MGEDLGDEGIGEDLSEVSNEQCCVATGAASAYAHHAQARHM